MIISFSLFGREIFSINVLKDDGLTSLALGAHLEKPEDEDDEDTEELPFGFSPPMN